MTPTTFPTETANEPNWVDHFRRLAGHLPPDDMSEKDMKALPEVWQMIRLMTGKTYDPVFSLLMEEQDHTISLFVKRIPYLLNRNVLKEHENGAYATMGIVVGQKVRGVAFFKNDHLVEFSIQPAERNKGYGSRFIQRLGAIENNHFHIIEATAESLPFYQKRGYHAIFGITREEDKVEFLIMKHILPEHRQFNDIGITMVPIRVK